MEEGGPNGSLSLFEEKMDTNLDPVVGLHVWYLVPSATIVVVF